MQTYILFRDRPLSRVTACRRRLAMRWMYPSRPRKRPGRRPSKSMRFLLSVCVCTTPRSDLTCSLVAIPSVFRPSKCGECPRTEFTSMHAKYLHIKTVHGKFLCETCGGSSPIVQWFFVDGNQRPDTLTHTRAEKYYSHEPTLKAHEKQHLHPTQKVRHRTIFLWLADMVFSSPSRARTLAAPRASATGFVLYSALRGCGCHTHHCVIVCWFAVEQSDAA